MRFVPTEPDIATTFSRIQQGDLDLQPDFQRGEVWSTAKKQRLIDTLIRGWVMPPILVVAGQGDHRLQVLDGQQRLASIRDFIDGLFAIDGRIEPRDFAVSQLHGRRFNDLPEEVRRRFLRMPIRTYEVSDFNPEEPAEIFFRLNQPATLSPAEKRNAFYGPVRDEVRSMVSLLEKGLESVGTVGFSNNRMAYDDVIARVAFSLNAGSLRVKVTSASVGEMYRGDAPLDASVSSRLKRACRLFVDVYRESASLGAGGIRLNKATMYSWLIFLLRFEGRDYKTLAEFFASFELGRQMAGTYNPERKDFHKYNSPLLLFNDRASSRAADVSSVLIRDIVMWVAYCSEDYKNVSRSIEVESLIRKNIGRFPDFRWGDVAECESVISYFAEKYRWGECL